MTPTERLDEGRFVRVHGLDQWITLRGAEAGHPALMIVTGAGAAFSPMAPLFAPWEQAFTLVQWDQPGAGATLARHGPTPAPFTYDRLARDGIAVTEQVRDRLGGAKIGLLAISGGTVIALKMIRARPDLFAAYVAVGQVVSWAEQEAASYATILARARAAGDAAAMAEIEGIGPPPWAEIAADVVKGKYANAMTPAEQAAFDPAVMAAVRAPPAEASYVARGLPPVDAYAASLAAYAALKPELARFDARNLGLEFEVPMVFLQGGQDAHTTTPEVAAYAAQVRAPSVTYEAIAEGGHMAIFLVERMGELLVRHVRPLMSQAAGRRLGGVSLVRPSDESGGASAGPGVEGGGL
jgi:pimeloyl-ACP methyl ester carboxylesterase